MTAAQERALERWEAQREQWEAFNAKMARKLGKRPSETLANTQWKFREKLEQLDVIDASVPQSHKTVGSNWEMTLRGGAAGSGGIRYVRVGGTYPYPLYCPIRDRDLQPPEANQFMRMVTEASALHSTQSMKPASTLTESEYYRTREKQFHKFIAAKFPHRVGGTCEAFRLEGQPPPVTDLPEEPLSDDEAMVGVHFRKPLEVRRSVSAFGAFKGTAGPTKAQAQGAEAEPAATPAEAATSSCTSVSTTVAVPGPAMDFSPPHLVFSTEPGVLRQSCVRIANTGTTALYFKWVKLPTDSIVPSVALSPEDGLPSPAFMLSDPPAGVLLPEEERYFTFSFLRPRAGVYVEDWELQTTPKVASECRVRLRGVVVSRDGDPLARLAMEDRLAEYIAEAGATELFTRALNVQEGNIFAESEVRQAERKVLDEEQARLQGLQAAELERQRLWSAHNPGMGLHYHTELYLQCEQLHHNVHRFLSATKAVPHLQPTEDSTTAEPSELPWNGSVALLYEEIQQITDGEVREEYFSAMSDLVRAARFAHPPGSEIDLLVQRKPEGARFEPLVAYAAMREALEGGFVEALGDAHHDLLVRFGLAEDPAVEAG
eukprot:RCo023358